MELIASLKETRSKDNGIINSTTHLTQVYKDAVGDKAEIDLTDFKKIVQSKNMFFVERIFRIFDGDNSGTVSMEEFLKVMGSFSKQSPAEKLQYLFKVYDINGDGSIELSELRNVINECMKENGLSFSENELDELTRMLFEDADSDGSGCISLQEFQEQLNRHPALMENLSLSVERWLLPPKDDPGPRQRFKRWKPQKLTWKHIRNNWSSVLFLMSYVSVNIILFATRAAEYSHHNGFVSVARACGQCLNFNCSFVLVLVLRQTLTWLRTHGLAQYLPIDQHLYYHKITGCFILGYSLLHTIMHIANFACLSSDSDIPLHIWLFSTELGIGWVNGSACLTGWLLLITLTIMFLSAMPFVRRNNKFEVFYCLHQLSIVFWICLIIHGPSFWKWFLAPAVFYIIETAIRINRNLSSSKRAYVQQGILLPSQVTQLVIKRPPKFDYRPGDYVYINIPAIAKFEWHPFTISSAPELDDVMWLHIRGIGEWTNSLHRYFEKCDEEAVLSDELARDLETHSMKNCLSVSTPFRNVAFVPSPEIAATRHCSSGGSGKIVNDTFNMASPSYKSSVGSIGVGNNTFQVIVDIHSENDSVMSFNPNKRLDHETVSHTLSVDVAGTSGCHRRTSFCSASSSRVIQRKNREDAKVILAEHQHSTAPSSRTHSNSNLLRVPISGCLKDQKRSVRVSVADHGFRRCQKVFVMPTVHEDDDDDVQLDVPTTEEEMKDLEREVEIENIVVTQEPLKIFLDGPYGSPTRHIFQARHAVLIATGIGVTPFASILQSIMYKYRKSRHTCPSCNHKWTDARAISTLQLQKVDFFWLNRHQKAFEWFVSLLSELEIEQAQLQEKDRFLDIHMYITSALDRTDMKAVGLQMALDLLYQKEKRCLITGLKSRTQPGRPNWSQVFKEIADQKKGKVTVFYCGPNELGRTLLSKCNEFGFRFRKEIF